MSLTVETVKDTPIIVITVEPPIDIDHDPADATKHALNFQKKRGGTVVRITDYTHVKLRFSDVMLGMAADTSFKDPHIINFIVGNDELVRLLAEAFKQEQYGGVDVKVFGSTAEALREARAVLSR